MNNTFNPIVNWRELRPELMHNGTQKYFPPVSPGRPEPAVVLITGTGNGKRLVFTGQTKDAVGYFRSGSAGLAKAQLIESICGVCKVEVLLEKDVMNGGQPLPAGFFNNEHVRKAIAEKTNVEHLMSGYTIV